MIQIDHLLMLGPHQSEEDEKDEEEVVALLLALHPHCQLKKFTRKSQSLVHNALLFFQYNQKKVSVIYVGKEIGFTGISRIWPGLR